MRSGNVRLRARVAAKTLAQLVCESARVLIISGWSMNIAAFSTRDLREQGHKSYEASLTSFIRFVISGKRRIAGWSCECFLTKYVNVGDLEKFSFMNDSQYTIFVTMIIIYFLSTNITLYIFVTRFAKTRHNGAY